MRAGNMDKMGFLKGAKLSAAVLLLTVLLLTSAVLAAPAKDNYRFYCAQCHGLEGRGDGPNAVESQPADPRDHTSAYEMRKLTDTDIINVIRDGGSATNKSTLMPPFKNTLTDREIKDLKELLRMLCKCKGA